MFCCFVIVVQVLSTSNTNPINDVTFNVAKVEPGDQDSVGATNSEVMLQPTPSNPQAPSRTAIESFNVSLHLLKDKLIQ